MSYTAYLEVMNNPVDQVWAPYRVDSTDDPPGDVAGLPPEGVLADNLVHSRSLPEGVPWPCQPNPEVLNFNLLCTDAAAATAAIARGSSVLCQVFSPALPEEWEFPFDLQAPIREFYGRVTEVSTETLEEGVLVAVTAADWTVSLAEAIIGDAPWPEERSSTRIDNILDAVALEYPAIPGAWHYEPGPHDPDAFPDPKPRVPLTARDVDARPALELLLEILSAWSWYEYQVDGVTLATPEAGRYQLGFTYAASFPDEWTLTPRLSRSAVEPHGTFGLQAGGGYGLVMVEGDGSTLGLVPASQVDLGARWTQQPFSAPTDVAVTVKDGAVDKVVRRRPNKEVTPNTYSLAVPIDYNDPGDEAPFLNAYSGAHATGNLADLLLPEDQAVANYWQPEDFGWSLEEAPDGAMLPDLGEVVTVAGIKDGANPTGRDFTEGLLESDTFTLANGHMAFTFSLRPRTRGPASFAPGFTLADFPAGVTIDQLSATDTLGDWRLLGTP